MERIKQKRRVPRKSYDHIDWTGIRRLRQTTRNEDTGKPFTQIEIAKRANITQAYYSKIELGLSRSPDQEKIKGLAAAFSTTASDLLAALPNKEPDKPAGSKPPAPEQRVIPKYTKSGKPKGFDFDDGVLMDSNDLTTAPPIIQNVPDAYAVVMPTDDMEPRFRQGDTLFVDPELSPYYGDDVVVKLQYQERTILLIRQLVDMEAVFDEDDEPIPTYGVLTASDIKDLTSEGRPATASHPIDELQMISENALWFTLYPEYVDAPKEVILEGEEANEGNPFAINVDVIVGSERHRYTRTGSPLKRRSEVNQDGNFGGFTGMPDDDTIKKTFKD